MYFPRCKPNKTIVKRKKAVGLLALANQVSVGFQQFLPIAFFQGFSLVATRLFAFPFATKSHTILFLSSLHLSQFYVT